MRFCRFGQVLDGRCPSAELAAQKRIVLYEEYVIDKSVC